MSDTVINNVGDGKCDGVGDGKVTFDRVWNDSNVQNVLRAVGLGFSRQMDDDALESCAIDTVIKVVRYYRTNHPRGLALTTAIHRAMHQVCLNHLDSLQRSRRRAALAIERETERHRYLENQRIFNDDSKCLEDVYLVLQKIQPEYAQIIRLRYLEGLTMESIAARLKITVSVADTRLRRALDTAHFAARLQVQEEAVA